MVDWMLEVFTNYKSSDETFFLCIYIIKLERRILMNKEEFNSLIDDIRNNIGSETSALNSEKFLGIQGAYSESLDKIDSLNNEISKLKASNDELLKVNGSLYLKIGKEQNQEMTFQNNNADENQEVKKIDISTLINEKGDLI
jgi:hypothetical protein